MRSRPGPKTIPCSEYKEKQCMLASKISVYLKLRFTNPLILFSECNCVNNKCVSPNPLQGCGIQYIIGDDTDIIK